MQGRRGWYSRCPVLPERSLFSPQRGRRSALRKCIKQLPPIDAGSAGKHSTTSPLREVTNPLNPTGFPRTCLRLLSLPLQSPPRRRAAPRTPREAKQLLRQRGGRGGEGKGTERGGRYLKRSLNLFGERWRAAFPRSGGEGGAGSRFSREKAAAGGGGVEAGPPVQAVGPCSARPRASV